MSINIGSIVWPGSGCQSVKLYLGFLIEVIEAFDIKFSGDDFDPVAISKKYVSGEVLSQAREECAKVWWGRLESEGALQDFESHDALIARLALCLLVVDENNVGRLGESLSWFLEVIGFLGLDVDRSIEIMERYFSFSG
ncbi:hypothetical protein GCM10009504_44350 [Pseudomonas laurentiana]|uniref:hypothetical protein n=1 Tax=Pseudomonas laurentiana TaxID=2364649 RepID=UPI00167582DD|nr:hypothetical protein [Pseudomonas laurentiana]GGU82998.1 hypothetical protein GCM10009504_44350 [Pseudomonas laurentiana]